MDRSIALATDVQADIEDVFEAVSTTAATISRRLGGPVA